MNSFDITAEFFHQQIEHISLAADAVAGMAEAAAPAVASIAGEKKSAPRAVFADFIRVLRLRSAATVARS